MRMKLDVLWTGRAASTKSRRVPGPAPHSKPSKPSLLVDSFALTEAEVIGDEVVVRGAFTEAVTSCIYDDNDFVEARVHNATTITCPASNAKRVQVGTSSEALSEMIRIATSKQFVVASLRLWIAARLCVWAVRTLFKGKVWRATLALFKQQ